MNNSVCHEAYDGDKCQCVAKILNPAILEPQSDLTLVRNNKHERRRHPIYALCALDSPVGKVRNLDEVRLTNRGGRERNLIVLEGRDLYGTAR